MKAVANAALDGGMSQTTTESYGSSYIEILFDLAAATYNIFAPSSAR